MPMTQNNDAITRQPEPAEESASKGSMRVFSGYKAKLVTVIAVLMSVYALLYIIRFFDNIGHYIPEVSHRSLILAFIFPLCFLLLPASKGQSRDKLPWYDVLLILISTAGPLYNFFTWTSNIERYQYQDFHTFEIVLCFVTILSVLEATRRALGLAMPIVTLVFIVHMFLGNYISGPFHTLPARLGPIVYMMTYSEAGIYGIAMGVAATIIIAFVIFGNFMFVTGAGDSFIRFSLSLFGHVRGGPAKVAVVASGLMGMISGATAANIATTGIFTIPLMKRVGYTPEFAGAVETVASNGGQIMPPIMGVVAFLMAEWLGIPYWNIALIAFVPAFLYFIAVFIMVDSEAGRLGLRGIPRSECPPILRTMVQSWIFFVPVLGLIFMLGVLMYSPQTAILYALGILLLLSAIKWAFGAYKIGGVTPQGAAQSAGKTGIAGLSGGATGMLIPGIACACAGIIIGTLSVTQIGMVLSGAAVKVAGGNQLILLVLAAFACFILGMGMSSLPAYIMVVIVVAPALTTFGVEPLLAHLFVFWFAITCFITPPVAIGAYVAAGIAGANPMRTGLRALRLGFCTYTLPFMLVYNPALVLQGSIGEIIVTIAASLVGIAFLSWGIGGYFLRKENRLQQVMLLVGGILFITLDFKMVIVGLILGAVVTVWQVRTVLSERESPKMSSG